MRLLLVFMALFLVSCQPIELEDVEVNHNFDISVEDIARAVEVLAPIAEFGADIPLDVLDDEEMVCVPNVCLTAGQFRDVRDFVLDFLSRQEEE